MSSLRCIATVLALALAASSVHAAASVHTIPYRPELRLHPFSDLPQTPFAWLDGATVAIEFGYAAGYDKLFFDYDGQFNITASFNAVNGVLYLQGSATSSEYTNAISSVVFFSTSNDFARRQLTYSFGANTFFFSLTEHYYRYNNVPGLTWREAAARCAASTFFNITGYLATVETADEQLELATAATFDAWLGGNDLATFGQYRWVTGYDGNLSTNAGPTFWTGQSQYADGVAPENVFTAWNRFQPENPQGSGQDFVYLVNSADQSTSYWAVTTAQDLVEGYICEYGSPATVMTSTQMGGSVELVPSCSLYMSQPECASMAVTGCAWSSSNQLCVMTACGKYTAQVNCEADLGCDWNVEGPIGMCVATPCASLAADVCATNPQCIVDRDGVTCRLAMCSDRVAACACNQQDGCSWRSGVCGNVQSLDCTGQDTVYVIDGSSLMLDTFGRYPMAFYGLTDALQDADFLMNGLGGGTAYGLNQFGSRVGVIAFGSTNLVPNGKGRLTSKRSELVSDLAWLQQSYAPTGAGRNIRTALETAVNMFDAAPNRTRSIVVIAAGQIGDALAIAKAYNSSSSTGNILKLIYEQLHIKLIGASISATSAATSHSVAATLSLQSLVDYKNYPATLLTTTIDNLPTQLFYGMCGNTGVSAFLHSSNYTSIRCDSLTLQTQCNLNEYCAWNPASQQCSNNLCLSNCDQSACDTNPACTFHPAMSVNKSSECVGACPLLNALMNDTLCNANHACIFDVRVGQCVNRPCLTNPTEDACIADTFGCEWNPTNTTPCAPMPCTATDPTACATEEGCAFSTICSPDPCKGVSDGTTCRAQVQCEWKSATQQCQLNECGQLATEAMCATTENCLWNINQSPPVCGPAPCTSYNSNAQTAKALCQLNSKTCVWVTGGAKDRCVQKSCELMTEACTCNQLEDCLWRNNTCKQNPFVQCPGTDVIFLVEATPVMLEPFGRHPNGYVGIVEAISMWSENAPFAATPDQAGFRFALVEYGQAKKALYTPNGVGGAGNLTNSLNQWLGPNQEVQWNMANMAAYASDGQSGAAALRPALQTALSIFNTAGTNNNRKRLLVIVGNSPITDGGSGMLREITQLELMGVKIFGNVIRRFSYITPLDETAAEFMRPIASDPPSVFFSFTTIDTMTDTLLENFCDPSSGTGEVLQISRNGELPCSWLEAAEECNLQGGCLWNASAVLTCPLAGQCPNLGCQPLPTNLDNIFNCEHCTLQSGAISCSRSNPPPATQGLCQKSVCALTCAGACAGTAGCAPESSTATCERNMCAPLRGQTACNANPGCVYKTSFNTIAEGTCEKSICARYRDSATCTSYLINDPSGVFEACSLDKTTTPQICVQKRCPDLNTSSCRATPQCTYSSTAIPRTCADKVCQYATAELCDFDATCFWDQFQGRCFGRQSSCVLTAGYSDWAPCSATCGAAITYKTRAILQYPTTGAACPSVARAGCSATSCAPEDKNLTIIQSCTEPPARTGGVWVPPFPSASTGEWPMDCTTYCADKMDRLTCIYDSACRWIGNGCQVKPFLGCQSLTRGACDASDMCAYDEIYGLCQPSMDVCPYKSLDTCNSITACAWRTGASALTLAASANIPIQLFMPGQAAIFPFDTLDSSDQTMVHGATVIIEGNYQRGKDVLQSTFTAVVSGSWLESAGTLTLSGRATVADYIKTIRFVTFSTTSTRTVPRTVSWSLGNQTAFGSATGHHYRSFENQGASYTFAEAECAKQWLYGLQGYLATVTSQSENDIIATKLFGDGWISGSDAALGKTWQYTTGPEGVNGLTFWTGPAYTLGGTSVNGRFTDWSPSNNTNVYGEPILNLGPGGSTGNDRAYLARTGYWESRPYDAMNAHGYICEFGGLSSDVPPAFPLGGSAMVGIGGCVATSCVWHRTQGDCDLDIECSWNNGICETGCGSRATATECTQSTRCRWDSSVLPPVCDVNPCSPLSQVACGQNTRCQWNQNDGCIMNQGCAALPQTDCAKFESCLWNGMGCVDRGCNTYTSVNTCRNIPRCRWDSDTTTCLDQYCQFPTEALCGTDATRCTWNMPTDPRSLSFTPNGGYAFPFQANVDPNGDASTAVDGITVALTQGFQPNADRLSIDPANDVPMNYIATYDGVTGVLSIKVSSDVTVMAVDAFQWMASYVRFSTTSGSTDPRRLTYVLSANTAYSLSSGTFYKWHPNAQVSSFTDAQQFCASHNLFDLTGSLAVLNSEVDAQLTRQLAMTGWISASSNANGLFSWTMPSGRSQPFWNGTGWLSAPLVDVNALANQSKYLFAQWDLNQPSLPSSFVFVEASGFWKSLTVMTGRPGVICQYGSNTVQSSFEIGGFRSAAPAGCFISMCKPLSQSQCGANPQCRWLNNACGREQRCLAGRSIETCGNLAQCYWDYDVNMCIASGVNYCNALTAQGTCDNDALCEWNPNLLVVEQGRSGYCVFSGCAGHPAQSPCLADPRCKWAAATCTARVCGYSTAKDCWKDASCVWEVRANSSSCEPSQCLRGVDASSCAAVDSCAWNTVSAICAYSRCTTTQGIAACLVDTGCLFKNGACFMPDCAANLSVTACSARPECFYFVAQKSCGAAQCVSYTSQSECEGNAEVTSLKQCIWSGGACRQPTYQEQRAPAVINNCEKQINPNMWWLWVFLAIILILLGMILHRLYLAHAGKGGNFLDATRKNYKYNPHERYAAALVDMAKDREADDNVRA
jgi:hypothetical protein